MWLNAVYVVFSCLGQLVSNKKEELTAILDHFNIQVRLTFTLRREVFTLSIIWDLVLISLWLLLVVQLDNPVSILNQEMSKQFLHSKNEADKYKVQHVLVAVLRETNLLQ